MGWQSALPGACSQCSSTSSVPTSHLPVTALYQHPLLLFSAKRLLCCNDPVKKEEKGKFWRIILTYITLGEISLICFPFVFNSNHYIYLTGKILQLPYPSCSWDACTLKLLDRHFDEAVAILLELGQYVMKYEESLLKGSISIPWLSMSSAELARWTHWVQTLCLIVGPF